MMYESLAEAQKWAFEREEQRMFESWEEHEPSEETRISDAFVVGWNWARYEYWRNPDVVTGLWRWDS